MLDNTYDKIKKDLWGEVLPESQIKKCRDCGEIKNIEEFSVNRKFFREDLPDKHYIIRRPTCKTCRSKKKKINGYQKKFFKKDLV